MEDRVGIDRMSFRRLHGGNMEQPRARTAESLVIRPNEDSTLISGQRGVRADLQMGKIHKVGAEPGTHVCLAVDGVLGTLLKIHERVLIADLAIGPPSDERAIGSAPDLVVAQAATLQQGNGKEVMVFALADIGGGGGTIIGKVRGVALEFKREQGAGEDVLFPGPAGGDDRFFTDQRMAVGIEDGHIGERIAFREDST